MGRWKFPVRLNFEDGNIGFFIPSNDPSYHAGLIGKPYVCLGGILPNDMIVGHDDPILPNNDS
jgi:hypothetical protein